MTAEPTHEPTQAAPGLRGVPLSVTPLQRKDFASDQEVRWCPGCGDYAILSAVQAALADLQVTTENTVIVSGIGCSSRFPYYMNTYGLHTLHGRAPSIATGIALARPDLSVWVATGDGDALSIGGNHLIHALRRNVNLTILLFNNRIYSLTKGQFSPTSEKGKITKTSPLGSVDAPFDPLALALGAGATFVARTVDSDRAHLGSVLQAAAHHRGAAFVEIYQNCPIFNDGAFADVKDKTAPDLLRLEAGRPIVTSDGTRGVVRAASGRLELTDMAVAGDADLVVHDPTDADPSQLFALAKLAERVGTTPLGVLRSVSAPVFDDDARAQVRMPEPDDRLAALQRRIVGGDTWTVA